VLEVTIIKKARSVKEASGILYNCTTAKKNSLLKAINDRLHSETSAILKSNRKDLKNA
jgi:gamma-glutamyl phosphate reductase